MFALVSLLYDFQIFVYCRHWGAWRNEAELSWQQDKSLSRVVTQIDQEASKHWIEALLCNGPQSHRQNCGPTVLRRYIHADMREGQRRGYMQSAYEAIQRSCSGNTLSLVSGAPGSRLAEKMLSHWKWTFFWHLRHRAKLKIMVSVPGITQAKNLPVDLQSFPSSCAPLCS